MAAYMIVRVSVTDWPRYQEYMKLSPAAIAAAGGRFIVRGGEMITLEGPPEPGRLVVVEFPDLEAAKAFYDSDLYTTARKVREGAAEAQFIAVAGV